MNHAAEFNDPANFNDACCGPELPHDTAEDIFLDARARCGLPPSLAACEQLLNWWSLRVFREFWRDWEEQEGGGHSSRTFGDEAAIRLLQALQNSHDRRTAMKAECYLAVINRKSESQTIIAKKYGVTRAAVSKVIVQIKDDLGLPTARHMKSDTARESYRARAKRVHAAKKNDLCKTPTPNSSQFNRLSTFLHALMPTLAPEN